MSYDFEPSNVCAEIKLVGSGYTRGLEDAVSEELSSAVMVLTRGRKSVAAGPGLSLEAIIQFLGDITADGRAFVVGLVLQKAIDTIRNHLGYSPVTANVTIKSRGYDLVIADHAAVVNGAEPLIRKLLESGIASEVDAFVKDELQAGNSVLSVTLPCEVSYVDGVPTPNLGWGNYNLWYVEYRDMTSCYYKVYDNVNKVFVDM